MRRMDLEAKGRNGQVRFDGRFVTIDRKGVLARLSVGKGEKRIPVAAITAVQWKKPGPMVNGFIQFTVAGGNERRSRFGSQTTDAARDENSVVFSRGQARWFGAIRAAVEAAIADQHRPAAAAAAGPLDQMAKLAELHAAGVLSDEEFTAKKADILDRL